MEDALRYADLHIARITQKEADELLDAIEYPEIVTALYKELREANETGEVSYVVIQIDDEPR